MKTTCTVEGCLRPAHARSYCAPHYATWHRQQRKYTITCAVCNREVQVDRPHRVHCSRICRNKASLVIATRVAAERNHAKAVARKLPVLYTGPSIAPQPRRRPRKPQPPRLFTSGACRVCGTWFASTNHDVTCSPACQATHSAQMKRLGKDRRRARKREAYVEDVYRQRVYERDGYKCHLCGKRTDRTKDAPHPRSPTLDHLIPLAAGGTHEPLNCRTACFLCNATKGDRGGGEQLLLIA
jgi:rubrerythrin